MTDLIRAEITFKCDSCGRPLRTNLLEVRERRTVRCLAGHRTELGISRERPAQPTIFDQDSMDA